MECPFCHAGRDHLKVLETRQNGQSLRRRRECGVCLERFSTYECYEAESSHFRSHRYKRVHFLNIRQIEKILDKANALNDALNIILTELNEIKTHMEANSPVAPRLEGRAAPVAHSRHVSSNEQVHSTGA